MGKVDYLIVAKQALVRIARMGELRGVTRQTVSDWVTRQAHLIEDRVNRSVCNELERLGHLQEFQKVLRYDTAEDVQVFLNMTIPNYSMFLRMALIDARREITDSALCQHAK
jgi:hypothetical protein